MFRWWAAASFGLVTALQPLPPLEDVQTRSNTTATGFTLRDAPRTVYIQRAFADVRDTQGLTLIPPTAYQFAETFRQDLVSLFGGNWTLQEVDSWPTSGILLGPARDDVSTLTYENGIATEEGYELEIRNSSVFIGGTGARGMFWGTRTLLQQLLIANGSSLQPSRISDAPAYATRGYMLDAGRKWYTAGFLKELCAYASFFKVSEFHYHSSDNYPLNRGRNETWNEVFSHFSLYPEENSDLQGIVQRKNETLSRAEFEDLQEQCARRGVTIIPEIEAPGHALAITKWKPELALAKKDLLNLSHPDAIPTVKAIWTEFLPWFKTKEVHIGADEYAAELADDYIGFVNEMATFVNTTAGKRIRIWGTYEPSENLTISKDIIVQHWQYGQSDPIQLQNDGYQLINSEDWWAYMSLKNDHTPILPAPYPQFYNATRTLNFANRPGWQWEPSLYNPVNTSQQLAFNASGNKGAVLAAWNDNGPDATTQLEAFYAMREGIPVMAARAWSGHRGANINAEQLPGSIAFLAPKAPGQNLDRRLPSSQNPWKTTPLISWTQRSTVSGNMSRGSYGPPYTLTLNVSAPFTLSGVDTTLSLSSSPANSTDPSTLVFTTSDGFPYPLRNVSVNDGGDPGHPGRIWTNQSSSTHKPVPITLPASLRIETDVVNGSRVWINDTFAGRFEVFVYGGRNTVFSWSQMALVAPLNHVDGGVDSLVLEPGVGLSENGKGNGGSAPPGTGAGRQIEPYGMNACGVMAFIVLALVYA
ncbi:glycoside hydrolase superfamily [Paraphoma chrysanthemicola]|uniref:beta-N-acetylhexosaminidase n=1 Tax=Paraphoma chrysanthemicola TaxID=798071 RepID=A0A8K0RFU2_9PLEO|nr:glycoside hydrolase superfamily [Paraphoma chrysanthemicola]